MPLTMKEKKALTRETRDSYRKAGKEQKGESLEEFTWLTKYNRSYAARILRQEQVLGEEKKKAKRKKKYGAGVLLPLRKNFIQSLDGVDVCSAWTETRALKDKARKWVFEALKDIKAKFPFPLLGLDCDNGGEFINAHLLAFCEENKITFTPPGPTARMTESQVVV